MADWKQPTQQWQNEYIAASVCALARLIVSVTLLFGHDHRHQLHDDGSSNVWTNTHREDGKPVQGTTGEESIMPSKFWASSGCLPKADGSTPGMDVHADA